MQVLPRLQFIVALLILAGKDGIAFPIARPGCADSCGNVSIPYPFGIGNGCYRDKWFEVTCNRSDDRAIPILQAYQFKVVNISDIQLEVQYTWDFHKCDFVKGSIVEQFIKPFFNDHDGSYNPFTFSHIHNKLLGIGCDTYSFITNNQIRNYTYGCISLCPSNSSNSESHYLFPYITRGVCQTTIPPRLKSFHVSILNFVSGLEDQPKPPIAGFIYPYCHHAFIAKQDFHYLFFVSEVPVILNWVLGEPESSSSINCDCGNDASCIDDPDGQGYHCQCNRGYEGNPYLRDGCQDVDECRESKKQPCQDGTVCQNTAGSYFCGCPSDFHLEHGHCIPHGQEIQIAIIVASGMAAGLSLSGIIIMVVLYTGRLERRRQAKLKEMFFKKNGGLLLQQQIISKKGALGKTINFAAAELEKATDNFNECRICGKGGFGTVYKGMLQDGKIVAIKKSLVVDENQVAQFINEVVVLSQINHRNIVRLLGCCLETEVPLLVYEFVCNGTLSDHLHGVTIKSSISWQNRLRIAVEVAGALAYLHSAASVPIFHRDVKSSNILLDENYKAKVADFGISRSVSTDKTHLTTQVKGTFGYLDPEYFHTRQFTEKSDVYSFGVVLVELLTGEKAVSDTKDEEEKSLVMNFISAMKENRVYDIVEARVMSEAKEEELLEFAMIAKACLKLNGKRRPTMKQVAQDLETLRMCWHLT